MMFYAAVLGAIQTQVLRQLGPILTPTSFYLGGGTAVALHVGHRHSVDLDWFTTESFPDPLATAQRLRDAGLPFRTTSVGPGTLHGTIRGVRVSLLEFHYPLLRKVVIWKAMACRLAVLPDLAAMKLSAVAQGGAKKDFVDVYALGKYIGTLEPLLEWYRRKFSVTDVAHLLRSLSYFDDADRERMPRMIWRVDWKTVKQAIQDWVLELNR
jgi:hypothetical protein